MDKDFLSPTIKQVYRCDYKAPKNVLLSQGDCLVAGQ